MAIIMAKHYGKVIKFFNGSANNDSCWFRPHQTAANLTENDSLLLRYVDYVALVGVNARLL